MRVALCISGAFRGSDFIDYLQDIIKEIAIPLNADTFIASWYSYKVWYGLGGLGVGWVRNWYSENLVNLAPQELVGDNFKFKQICPNIYKELEIERDKKITSKILQKLKSLRSVKGVGLSNEREFMEKYPQKLEICNSAKMFYGFYQALKLLLDYEAQNKFYYDYLIVVRPDKKYTRHFSVESLSGLGANEIAFSSWREGDNIGLDDSFALGSRYALVEYLGLFKKAELHKPLEFFRYFPSGVCCHEVGFLDHFTLANCINFLGLKLNENKFLSYTNPRRNPKIVPLKKALQKDKKHWQKLENKPDFSEFFMLLDNEKILKADSAVNRVKHSLSYKLGAAILENYKSVGGILKLPFILNKIANNYKKEQDFYNKQTLKNPLLKLPPLESYSDFAESLRLKNHLSYKLGAAIIAANNRGFAGIPGVLGGGGNMAII
ncbi:MAG: hypothetical protein PUB96_04640 [Helicobacteraceae bacterium]|nr:hypothetical protein [Helicobacteraceae bacterium]